MHLKDSLELPPLLLVVMDDASIYTVQVSADEGLHSHTYHHPPFSTISLSPTLVNNAHHTERTSITQAQVYLRCFQYSQLLGRQPSRPVPLLHLKQF